MEKKFRKPVSEILLPDILDGEGDIIPIIADGDDGELEDVEVPEQFLYCHSGIRAFPGSCSSNINRHVQNQFSL